MSDLNELRRQRELLKGHLAWLEKEIAAEEGRHPSPPPDRPPALRAEPPVDDRDAEAILSEYRTPSASIAWKTKLGCLAYFGVAVLLTAGAVLAFYLLNRTGHPPLR